MGFRSGCLSGIFPTGLCRPYQASDRHSDQDQGAKVGIPALTDLSDPWQLSLNKMIPQYHKVVSDGMR